MSAHDCIRHIRERARTWPDAGGRLALMKMARELEELPMPPPDEPFGVLHVREWSATSEPRQQGPLGQFGEHVKELRIYDGIVVNPPKWVPHQHRTSYRPLVFNIMPHREPQQ